MNDDPKLLIFEPLRKPRTVILRVIEDINAAPPVIFDEYGHEVTNYKVLNDESESIVSPKEEIIAYIENWESQGNAVDEKKAKRIAKKKRLQLSKKERKARNKKRKTAMKSLIRCNLDSSPLDSTDVEEERAILRAMKSQKQNIKSILNIKPNRIINCNTNVRPFENSTIEIGSKKTPIDVVVLDSDEESNSDDDIKININTPQPVSTRRRRKTNVAVKSTSRIQKAAVPIVLNTRKRRNKKYEVVKIDDSSDSDVECISCDEFIQSLSDDDDDKNNASKKKRLKYINLEDEPTVDPKETDCVVPIDEEASNDLISMVDSFYNKYIQSSILPLTEIVSHTNSAFPASQIVITEPISLQPNSAPISIDPQKISNTASQIMTTEPVSLQPKKNKLKKGHGKQVTFNNVVEEKAEHETESTVIENEQVNDLVQLDSHDSDANEEAESENESENLNEFVQVSEDDAQPEINVLEFNSIPSPDYTPMETIPATASNMKAFADFLKSHRPEDVTTKEDGSEYDSPIESEEPTPALTTKITPKPNNPCPTSPKCVPVSSKNQCYPWQNRGSEESEEIAVVEQLPSNHVQFAQPWQKSHENRNRNDEIEAIEHSASSSRSSHPWLKNRDDKSDETQVIEHRSTIRDQPTCSQKRTPVSVITRPVRVGQVNFDKQQQLPIDEKFDKNSFHKSSSSPKIDDTGGGEDQRSNRPSAFSRLDKTITPTNQRYCSNNRRVVFGRLGDFEAESPKLNSAIELFGESRNDLQKIGRSREYFEKEYDVEPTDGSRRNFYSSRNMGSKEPYQNQYNSLRRPFQNRFHQQRDQQYGVWLGYEEEPSQYDAATETKIDDEMDIDKSVQSQEYCEEFRRRDKCYPETKYESYQENKYTAENTQSVDNRRLPWRNRNRGRFNHGNQFRRDNQYHNRRTGHNENNFNRGNRFRPRISNQGQRSDRHLYRQNTQNAPRYGQQTRANFRNSYGNQLPSFTRYNQRQNEPQPSSTSSLNTCNVQNQTNQEVLFTRRSQFNYKANVSDFDDCNDQQQRSSQGNACYRVRNNHCNQQNVKNYETDVAKKLRSDKSDENAFVWENNKSQDFVPFNANEPVDSSPPWNNDNSNTNYSPRINAISRRSWINDTINSKL